MVDPHRQPHTWEPGEARWPASPVRRAAAVALDGVVLGWFLAWLLLPVPNLSWWGALAIVTAYTVLGEGWRGRTLGKAGMALEVRRADDLGPLGWGRAAVRTAARMLPAVIALGAWTWLPRALAWPLVALAALAAAADHVWALRQPMRRTGHDLIAGAIVLHRARPKLFTREES